MKRTKDSVSRKRPPTPKLPTLTVMLHQGNQPPRYIEIPDPREMLIEALNNDWDELLKQGYPPDQVAWASLDPIDQMEENKRLARVAAVKAEKAAKRARRLGGAA